MANRSCAPAASSKWRRQKATSPRLEECSATTADTHAVLNARKISLMTINHAYFNISVMRAALSRPAWCGAKCVGRYRYHSAPDEGAAEKTRDVRAVELSAVAAVCRAHAHRCDIRLDTV